MSPQTCRRIFQILTDMDVSAAFLLTAWNVKSSRRVQVSDDIIVFTIAIYPLEKCD